LIPALKYKDLRMSVAFQIYQVYTPVNHCCINLKNLLNQHMRKRTKEDNNFLRKQSTSGWLLSKEFGIHKFFDAFE
jgi:hypothetical protein